MVIYFSRKESGFSTIEILIAMTILVTALSAAALASTNAISLSSQLQQQALAIAHTQSVSDQARIMANWNAILPASASDGIFQEQTAISDYDSYIKEIANTISWSSDNQIQTISLNALVGDWQSAGAVGSCPTAPAGNWSEPYIDHILDLGTTGAVNGVDVHNGYAYIAADGNSTQFDFFVVDVSGAMPTIVRQLDTGPGLAALTVVGPYAYLANTSINSQLQIVDISNPSAAYVRSVYKLPGSGSGDTATSIFYDHGMVYLGIKKSAALGEFHVIDVTNVDNPREVGTFEFNTTVNAIYISDGLAYIATPDDQELKVLDVHDPTNITLVGGYDAPGGSGNGNSFARSGRYLYLGRTVGNDELYRLDINNITAGALASGNVNASVNGLVAMGNSLVMMATTDAAREFQAWQVSSDGSSLQRLSSIDLPAKGLSIACRGEQLYVTTEDSHNGLIIINPGS